MPSIILSIFFQTEAADFGPRLRQLHHERVGPDKKLHEAGLTSQHLEAV